MRHKKPTAKVTTDGGSPAPSEGESPAPAANISGTSGLQYDRLILFNATGVLPEKQAQYFWESTYKEMMRHLPDKFDLLKAFDIPTRTCTLSYIYGDDTEETKFCVFLKVQKGT